MLRYYINNFNESNLKKDTEDSDYNKKFSDRVVEAIEARRKIAIGQPESEQPEEPKKESMEEYLGRATGFRAFLLEFDMKIEN